VAAVRRQRWLEENRDAIDNYNARIERDGLTLARYRQF
jgi:antitoxin CcdA